MISSAFSFLNKDNIQTLWHTDIPPLLLIKLLPNNTIKMVNYFLQQTSGVINKKQVLRTASAIT